MTVDSMKRGHLDYLVEEGRSSPATCHALGEFLCTDTLNYTVLDGELQCM